MTENDMTNLGLAIQQRARTVMGRELDPIELARVWDLVLHDAIGRIDLAIDFAVEEWAKKKK